MACYDPVLAPWVNREVAVLEIGVHRGGSLLLWRDYFPLGTIAGIDLHLPEGFVGGERIRVFEGNQTDTAFLTEVANEVAPDGFDIIIDDASHIGEFTKAAFWHLFDSHLKPGGLYAIEDWFTGYWDDWPDGKSFTQQSQGKPSLRWRLLSRLGAVAKKRNLKIPTALYQLSKKSFDSHSYGLVGFVKQLIDEQGAAELTKAVSDGAPKRQSMFDSILVTPNIVFVKKRLN